MSVNLAGSNKVETFSAVGVNADPNGPYTNTGGANAAATLTLAATAADVIVTESDDAISGTGNAISVVLFGLGTFEFLGAEAYTGGTIIEGGELSIGNVSALGTGALTFAGNDTTLQSTVTGTLMNSVTIDLGVSATIGATFGHTLTIGGAAFSVLGQTGATLHFGSAADDGTVIMAPTSNGQTGIVADAVSVDGGTLVLGSAEFDLAAFGGGVTVGSGGRPATLDLDGQSQEFANLAGASAGVITNNGGNAGLTVANTTSTTFAGTIENGSGTVTLEIAGVSPSTFTLTGANTYTGVTEIEANSTLQIGDGGTNGSLATPVVYVDGGALAFDLASNMTFAAGIADAGSLIQEGAGTLTLSNSNPYSGGTTIENGEISISNVAALGSGGVTFAGDGVALESSVTATLTNLMTIDPGVSATIGATAGITLTLAGAGFNAFGGDGTTLRFGSAKDDGTVVLAPTGNLAPTDGDAGSVDGGTLEIKSGTALLSGMDEGLTVGASAAPATLDFDLATHESVSIYDLAGTSAGVITDNGASVVLDLICSDATTFAGVIKNGSQAIGLQVQGSSGDLLALTGANDYTGGTTIMAGATLRIGDGGATGSIAGAIVDNGAFEFDRSGKSSFAGAISGSGALIQKGAGSLELTGANSFSGGATIYNGELELGAATSAGTGAIGFGDNSFATLGIAAGVDPTNTINMSDATDAIDFAGLGYAAGDHLVLLTSGAVSTYALETSGGAKLETLHFGGSFNVASLGVGADGAGGTEIGTDYSAALAESDSASIIGADARILIDDTAAHIAAQSAAITTLMTDGDVGSLFTSNAALSDGGLADVGVVGGADAIALTRAAGDSVSLYGTAGHADTVNGTKGTVNLYSAQATVVGSSDAVHFAGGSTLTASGGADLLAFAEGIGGVDKIAGFASTDKIELSMLDFANFAALQSHLTQSSAGALITLNAADTITLTGVQESTLTAAEFKFV